MRYVSTRGAAPVLGFTDALLAGLATDGGLYVPEVWPSMPERVPGSTYAERAAQIIQLFVGDDLPASTVLRLCNEAYGTFAHQSVVPLVQLDHHHFVMELFHGPTLAFKDVALQLVGRLFDEVLRARGQRVTIVGATSGDTGSAAIDGVKNCANVDIVILYPYGRTSDVQRKQMTTVHSPNVRVVAVDGTFDDCQDMVKAMFNDTEFRDRMGLSAVNSINWARVMAQVVYYAVATDLLGGPIDVCVPSGNFGNVFAGWIAQRMGAPIEQLIVASNANDILTRFFNHNDMSAAPVEPSLSPSMDIQVSSNFERFLYYSLGRDPARVREVMAQFKATGAYTFAHFDRGTFSSSRCTDGEIEGIIRRVYREHGYIVDPHTACGFKELNPDRVSVVLSTAHPAKFPDAIKAATGVDSTHPALEALKSRPVVKHRLKATPAAIRAFIEQHADRKSTRLNSSHVALSRMPSSA